MPIIKFILNGAPKNAITNPNITPKVNRENTKFIGTEKCSAGFCAYILSYKVTYGNA
jgi:hypothetical protein